MTTLNLRKAVDVSTLGHKSYGVNPHQLADFLPYRFINICKHATPWSAQGGAPAARLHWNADRYIECNAETINKTYRSVFASTGYDSHTGNYKATWTGTGTINIAGGAGKITGVSINYGTKSATFHMNGSVDGACYIEVTNTSLGDHIRNIAIVRQADTGYVDPETTPLLHKGYQEEFDAGDWIVPEVMDDWIARLSCLRPMWWTGIVYGTHRDWSDRGTVDAYTYGSRSVGWDRMILETNIDPDTGLNYLNTDPWLGDYQEGYDGSRGVPWEVCIEICNQAQCDLWVCVPHAATDDYITQLATLVRDTLDPNLMPIVEYSNEFWNPYYSTEWCQVQAWRDWGGVGVVRDNSHFHQWCGKKSVLVRNIFASVFGTRRFHMTISAQANWLDWLPSALEAPTWETAWLAEEDDDEYVAPYTVIDSISIATYINPMIEYFPGACEYFVNLAETSGAAAAAEWLIDDTGEGFFNDTFYLGDNRWNVAPGIMATYGVRLNSYEGGQHMQVPSPLFAGGYLFPEIDLSRDNAFYDVVRYPGEDSTTCFDEYVGDGVTTVFNRTFPLDNAANLYVYLTETTTLTLNTHYTVDTGATGTLTFLSLQPNGTLIILENDSGDRQGFGIQHSLPTQPPIYEYPRYIPLSDPADLTVKTMKKMGETGYSAQTLGTDFTATTGATGTVTFTTPPPAGKVVRIVHKHTSYTLKAVMNECYNIWTNSIGMGLMNEKNFNNYKAVGGEQYCWLTDYAYNNAFQAFGLYPDIGVTTDNSDTFNSWIAANPRWWLR